MTINIGAQFHPMFKLNTQLWLNCLEDVTNEAAWRRLSDRTNSAGFIALHLIDARYYVANLLGLEVTNPYREALAKVRSVEDLPEEAQLPVEELRAAWQAVSAVLLDGLPTVSDELFQQVAPSWIPVEDKRIVGGLQFLLNHESYHIGQMALLRKYDGLPAMKYT